MRNRGRNDERSRAAASPGLRRERKRRGLPAAIAAGLAIAATAGCGSAASAPPSAAAASNRAASGPSPSAVAVAANFPSSAPVEVPADVPGEGAATAGCTPGQGSLYADEAAWSVPPDELAFSACDGGIFLYHRASHAVKHVACPATACDLLGFIGQTAVMQAASSVDNPLIETGPSGRTTSVPIAGPPVCPKGDCSYSGPLVAATTIVAASGTKVFVTALDGRRETLINLGSPIQTFAVSENGTDLMVDYGSTGSPQFALLSLASGARSSAAALPAAAVGQTWQVALLPSLTRGFVLDAHQISAACAQTSDSCANTPGAGGWYAWAKGRWTPSSAYSYADACGPSFSSRPLSEAHPTAAVYWHGQLLAPSGDQVYCSRA